MVDKFNLEKLNRLDLFFQLFNNMNDLVFLTKVESNQKFSYVLVNKPAKELYGFTDESFGKPLDEVLPKNAYDIVKSKYLEVMEKKVPIVYEDKVIVKSGMAPKMIYWESTITPVFNQDGSCTHFLAIVRDITDKRHKENEIKKIKDRFELVWNSVADAMYTFDKDENFVAVNKSFEKLLGWTEEELLKDKSISIVPKDGKEDLKEIIEKIKQGGAVPSHEVKRISKTGHIVNFLASYSPIYDEDGDWDGGVVVYKDITDRKKYEEKLKHLALHDPLTGLPNRTYFSQILNIEMKRAKTSKNLLSVFILDIDHFKDINDTFGHDIGDELLKEFASCVKTALRKNDIIARMGGDEFLILLPDLMDKKNVIEIADRIQRSLQNGLTAKKEKLQITCSIGIALNNQFDLEEITIIKQADLALYKAKEQGRNNYQIYPNQGTG
jgi:diguanylate cyclase (GGDEF)-like protein/PAS domain S-box-containing protein